MTTTTKIDAACVSSDSITICYSSGLIRRDRLQRPSTVRSIKRVQNEMLYMNDIQRSMYRKLMYGMDDMSFQQIKSLSKDEEFSIIRNHMHTKEAINRLKYEKYYKDVNKLLSVIIPNSVFGYKYDGNYYDYPLPSLRQLKISTRQVINTLISNKLLPDNFYELDKNKLNL